MRVLVTGAAGFLGTHIRLALTATGHEVIPLDLPQYLTDFRGGLRFSTRIQDKLEPPKGLQLDAVIHLAAIASPALCDKDPATAFAVNVQGTHNVLKLALATGAKRFVMASSAHVYGISPRYLPTDERHPLWLQDTYTSTKILGEQLCQLFHDNYGLSYAAIRLFNGYGPNQQLGYFIPDQIAKAKTGHIDLRGHQITKDWIFIDDVARAYLLAMQSEFVGAINVGTGKEATLGYIAAHVARAFGAQMVISGHPQGGPTRMCADWGRAQRVLGWEPKVSLEEGLERTIQSWKEKG